MLKACLLPDCDGGVGGVAGRGGRVNAVLREETAEYVLLRKETPLLLRSNVDLARILDFRVEVEAEIAVLAEEVRVVEVSWLTCCRGRLGLLPLYELVDVRCSRPSAFAQVRSWEKGSVLRGTTKCAVSSELIANLVPVRRI